jgi:hypothetical protein
VEKSIEIQCRSNFVPWLQSWIDVSLHPASPVRAHLITFEDIVRDLSGSVHRIIRLAQGRFPAVVPYAQCADLEEVRIHFNGGDDHAWRSEVGESTKAALWDSCTPEMRDLLRLSP